jgi:hypothetical protein
MNICEDNFKMGVTEIRREIVWRGFIWPRTGKN